MNNIVRMYKLDTFADLSYNADARLLGKQEVFGDDSVEEFSAIHTAATQNRRTVTEEQLDVHFIVHSTASPTIVSVLFNGLLVSIGILDARSWLSNVIGL